MKLHTLFIAAALTASAALAETKTASTQVSLSVLPDCTISATDVDLGVYNARTGASGTGTIKLTCNVKNMKLSISQSQTAKFTGPTGGAGRAFELGRQLTGPGGSTIDYAARVSLPDYLSVVDFGSNRSYIALTPNGSTPAGLVNPLQGVLLKISASVAPGLWKPAGQYTDLITYTLDYTP